MPGQISRQREIEALKIAARWPGADRNTVVLLATRLAAAGSIDAAAEGYSFFEAEAQAHPDRPLLLALAGFFQIRAGHDVGAGIAKLDRAAAAELGLPNYFRGLALADLAPDRERAETAVTDLEFVLAVRQEFPPAMIRAVHHALAAAYATVGKDDLAAQARGRSGLDGIAAQAGLQYGGQWMTAKDGFRFTSPSVLQPEPGVFVLQGYDFGDFALVATGDGIVAIDAGTTAARVRAGLDAADLPGEQRITHVILTHSHFDHIGGTAALLGPGTQIVTHANFPDELHDERRGTIEYSYFLGDGSLDQRITPDRLISEPESVTVGGVEFALYPTPGGETRDALMVYLPASRLLFTGDVMMPYVGAPFFAEGSPDGLLDTLRFIRRLQPRMLIHGHTPLTELFTVEAVAGLEAALTQWRGEVIDAIRQQRPLAVVLDRNYLPGLLRDHPAAVIPYVLTRDHFAARLYHQRTGYWKPGREGLEPLSPDQRAAALDLLAGGREDSFVAAAATLVSQGDHALALEIIEPGLLRHPASEALTDLRRTALLGLSAANQQMNPFKFLIYSELAGVEIGPVE